MVQPFFLDAVVELKNIVQRRNIMIIFRFNQVKILCLSVVVGFAPWGHARRHTHINTQIK